jgi:hypothetical protein
VVDMGSSVTSDNTTPGVSAPRHCVHESRPTRRETFEGVLDTWKKPATTPQHVESVHIAVTYREMGLPVIRIRYTSSGK